MTDLTMIPEALACPFCDWSVPSIAGALASGGLPFRDVWEATLADVRTVDEHLVTHARAA